MIDSHCHLDYLPDPASARGELGLSALICVGASVEHAHNAVALAAQFDDVWASVGLHPTDVVKQDSAAARAEIERLSLHPRVVAIGETGLDDYWSPDEAQAQREAFVWQLELGRQRNLPVIVHTRDAAPGAGISAERASLGCAELIAASGWHKGVLHCCNGHAGLLRAALDAGWYVSFAGNLTYKNAHSIQEAARNVPAERLLTETDAPFLAPVPKRGKPNRPGYVRYTCDFLAALRGVSGEEMDALTDANARAVYGLPAAPR